MAALLFLAFVVLLVLILTGVLALPLWVAFIPLVPVVIGLVLAVLWFRFVSKELNK
jgi:hypothetical protein